MQWSAALGAGFQLVLFLAGALAFPVIVVGWFMASPYEARGWLTAMAIATLVAAVTDGRAFFLCVVALICWWGFGWAPPMIGLAILSAAGLPFMFVMMGVAYLASRKPQ